MASPLALNLPTLSAKPANPPETRPSRIVDWLTETRRKSPVEASRIVGDALAATNRVAMSDSRRLELAELYWGSALVLWPELERLFARSSHPLSGHALEAAKAALTLSHELSTAYKHLLAREASKRISLGGQRLMVALVNRCLQCTARILVNSYLAYAPVPPKTWHDAHVVYAFARSRKIHHVPVAGDQQDGNAERTYVQALLLALANPYGFLPGQIHQVLRYLQEHAHEAKLTDVAPVHRMAKAVAIVPVGHDFPPFSANKGGTMDGSKLFLLTFDLAFALQEQIAALNAGASTPDYAREPGGRVAFIALLTRLLRQWAIPPARQFNRLPSRARVVICAGLSGVWQHSRGTHAGVKNAPTGIPAMSTCQVINHTPAGYALRQSEASPPTLRIGELVALKVEGRGGLQVAMVRWFRNTLKTSALEFGCELVSDAPEAAAATPDGTTAAQLVLVVVVPQDSGATGGGSEHSPAQLIVPAGAFQLEQAVTLKRAGTETFAVLTKLVEQGPGFEIFEYVAVD
ncbi:MAG TPA: hypothetical protein VNG69_06560 [Casimicrobiaceae bacterium]|nr:hypothetical protein [Casimicrobiaceae bacterium]